MKTKILIATILSAAVSLLTTQSVSAQAKDAPAHAEAAAKVKIPATKDDILREIHKHHLELAATIKARKLDVVHEQAFAIRDLAQALPAKVNPDHKKMVENAVKLVSQLAQDLDKSGDAGDQLKTEANLKKMDAALKTLEEHAAM